MRRLRRITLAALGVALLAASSAVAAGGNREQPLPASARLAGLTGSDLLGAELSQLTALPADQSPYFGNGGSCYGAGHGDKVLILWTLAPGMPADCTVKPGTPVFLYTFQAECSDVEAKPFRGATEAKQRKCALGWLASDAAPVSIDVTVDGGAPVDIRSDRYVAVTSQQSIIAPPHPNYFGSSGGPVHFVGAGWVVMLHPLAPGTHTIGVATHYMSGSVVLRQGTVDVVPGHTASGEDDRPTAEAHRSSRRWR